MSVPTAGMLKYARDLGIPNPESYTRSELSRAISLLAERRNKEREKAERIEEIKKYRSYAKRLGANIPQITTLRQITSILIEQGWLALGERGIGVGSHVRYFQFGEAIVEKLHKGSRQVTIRSVDHPKMMAHNYEAWQIALWGELIVKEG